MYLPGALVGCLVTCMESKRSPETVANGENSTNKLLSTCTTILYVMVVRRLTISKVKVNQLYVIYRRLRVRKVPEVKCYTL